MVKAIQGLRKRTGSVSFLREGVKADDFGGVNAGDIAHVFHESGARASIRIDAVGEEGTFLGTVVRCDGKIPGLSLEESVLENFDFVFVVSRGEPPSSA